MTLSHDLDVLIAGAGAAGLTLAIDLARRGVAFRIVDKAATPFCGSRGKGLQPRSQEVFEDLGVLDRIAGLGGPYPVRRAYGPDGAHDLAIVEGQPATPAEPYGQALMLSQGLTEGVLRDRLAELGAKVAFGVALKGFEDVGDAVIAQLETAEGPQTLRARYLVGADGGTSFVRKQLGVGFPGDRLPVRALVADVAVEGLSRDAWHSWNIEDRRRMFALCPLAGTDLFQLQTALPLEGEVDVSDAGLAAMIAERTGRDDLRLRSVQWRSMFEPSARLADRYRVGRIFLAGDAAHVHPPTGGQGLNTSVQDAYNLGWKLGAVLGGAPTGLLDTYETERRPIAAGVLNLSTGLLKSGDARRGRENHELDLGYFDSPLAIEHRARPGRLLAGARAPDAPCRGAGGQPTRLFDIFRGPHATLIGYRTDAPAPLSPRQGLRTVRIGPHGDLEDDAGHIAEAYDLDPGDWVLVRPDGYVGAIADPQQASAMAADLVRTGLVAA